METPLNPKPGVKKTSISILLLSLPLLYVSFLRIPPSGLIKDTTFWFLLSNSIILMVAADSGVFSTSGRAGAADACDEYIHLHRNLAPRLATEPEKSEGMLREGKCRRCSSEMDAAGEGSRGVDVEKRPQQAATVKSVPSAARSGEGGSEYWRMSDEELNRRVEEFIRRFNREIMLQKTSE